MMMMLTRSCWKLASTTSRATRWPAILASSGNGSLKLTKNFSCGGKTNEWITDSKTTTAQSVMADARHLLNAYRSTDFETTLNQAPKYALWAAIVPLVPLVTKTAWSVITLSFSADYASIVISCVSAYVCTANGWWLHDTHNMSYNDPDSGSSSSWSMWQSLQKTVGPATICAIAIVALPQYMSVMAVAYAAFLMTCRLVLNDPASTTVAPWCKSLVLLVYGVFVPTQTLALVCALFS